MFRGGLLVLVLALSLAKASLPQKVFLPKLLDLDWPQNCGIAYFQPNIFAKIISGNEARPHSWPWQVSLQTRAKPSDKFVHVCGGTLIHKRWVLTAAHCFQKGEAEDVTNWRILLGKHHLRYPESTERSYRVKRIYRHENFRYPQLSELEHDIALVKPVEDIMANKFVRYACLPNLDTILHPGHFCWVTGWGGTRGIMSVMRWISTRKLIWTVTLLSTLLAKSSGHPPFRFIIKQTTQRGGKENLTLAEVLNQAKLPVLDFNTCHHKKFWGNKMQPSMLCAGLRDNPKSPAACQGDSGGPLVCQVERDSWEVHGVVSFGPVGCQVPNKPTVFTRTSAFIPWIEATRLRDFFL